MWWKRDRKVVPLIEPPGLPERRPRPLTPPLPLKRRFKAKQENNPQLQSPFFARFPLEIREIIYGHAIGESVIHLETSGGVFCHRLCPEPEQGRCGCRHLRRRGARRALSPLPLLLTCRMVYSEAIKLLYSTNSFSVLYYSMTEDPFQHRPARPLINLPKLLLPQRLHAIRSLSLFWVIRWLSQYYYFNFPHSPRLAVESDLLTALIADWELVWKVISSMRGLQHLHVDVALGAPSWPTLQPGLWQKMESLLLEPVKVVTTPLKSFRMVLPCKEGAKTLKVGGRVWEIERPHEGTLWADVTLGWLVGDKVNVEV